MQSRPGNPPGQYTTNPNESINSRVKYKVDYKVSELHIFCEKFEELVDMQTRSIELAFTIGNGPYRVAPLYSELKQKPNIWLKLSKSAKQQFLKKVQLQEVKGKPVEQYISQENQDIENIPPLSMSFAETGLSDIVYKCMWNKAAVLYHKKLISDVPGYADGKMVASKSSPGKPHLVSCLKSGKFTCDCINYKSKSLCSHVIAVAESTGALSLP